jgi:hypothetical protein
MRPTTKIEASRAPQHPAIAGKAARRLSDPLSSYLGRQSAEILAFPIELSDFDSRLQYIGNLLGNAVRDAWRSAYREAIDAPELPFAEFLTDSVIGGRVEGLRAVLRYHQQRDRRRAPSCANYRIKRRPGRPLGAGAYRDEPLIEEMLQLTVRHEASSVRQAASKVADRAEGASTEAKIARLSKKYLKKYRPPQRSALRHFA